MSLLRLLIFVHCYIIRIIKYYSLYDCQPAWCIDNYGTRAYRRSPYGILCDLQNNLLKFVKTHLVWYSDDRNNINMTSNRVGVRIQNSNMCNIIVVFNFCCRYVIENFIWICTKITRITGGDDRDIRYIKYTII